MPLETGRQLGPYEIVSSLGAGGMGEVYEATDTRLGRTVAIKVLPEAFVADPERLARFEREARVLATLNHPKIAGIYDVGEETGTHFLVMELAAGETLDERIVHGPVPVGEALSIAVQITAGLEAAHARGIVHRDLKPANFAVDEEGEVKVLDFGLARALEPDPESQTVTELARSPTLTYRPTEAGVLLGTAAYMSPEQARGKAADERSDLWALGVVLWEMLTGRRLFGGDTVSDTLASVLKEEPDWTALPPETPPAARRLLRRCLTKDPAERLHHAADARLEIEDAAGESEHGAEPEERRRVRERDRRRSLVGVAALSLLTGLLGLLIGSRIGPGDESEEHRTVAHNARFAMAPSDRAQTRIGPGLAISPDASHLAFVGFDLEDETRRLYLRAT